MQHQIDVIIIFSICKFCFILLHQRPQGCAQDMAFPCSLLSFMFVAITIRIKSSSPFTLASKKEDFYLL